MTTSSLVRRDRAAVQPVPPKPSLATRIFDWLQFIRSILVNGLIIAAVLAMIVFAVLDMWRQPVIVETFGLPDSLSERGFSGAVAAHRVWDAVTAIQQEAGTLKRTQSLLAESRQLDVVEPGTGLSLRNFTRMLRSLAGIEQTRIAGEFICDADECGWQDLRLRMRVFADGRMHIINTEPIAEGAVEALFHQAALSALEIIDPYVFAAFHFSKGEEHYPVAVATANHMIDTGHLQSAWAANLLGNHAQAVGNHKGAIAKFEEAIEIAEDKGPRRFALPDYGRGNSLFALKEYEMALEAFDRAIGQDSHYASPHFGRGQTLMALDDHRGAAIAFRTASELDRNDAAHWAGLGDAMTRLKSTDEAIEHLERAVRLDAGFTPARVALSRLLSERERHDAALRHLKIAIEFEPDHPPFWDALAAAHEAAGDDDAAEDAIKQATDLRIKKAGVIGSNILASLGWMGPDQKHPRLLCCAGTATPIFPVEYPQFLLHLCDRELPLASTAG